NPEEIIKYFDWAWSAEEADMFYSFGIEDHNYTIEDGEIQFDANEPVNADNFMRSLFAVYMNPRGDSQLSDLVLDIHPLGDSIQKGLDIASEYAMPDDGKNMPNLDAYAASPEIKPGAVDGTLFLEMFAKVVTGREDL